jgi:hypothetical protein
MKQYVKSAMLLVFGAMLTSCASSKQTPSSNPPASSSQSTAQASADASRIVGNIPPGSKFSQLKLGMTQGEAHEIIGQPTDSSTYNTGKMWIPFYFGSDVMRLQERYKGQGNITYTGSGIGGTHFTVYRIEYDPNESGHARP